MTAEFEEGERQMIVLALSRLAVERPGWSIPIDQMVAKLHAEEMFRVMKLTYVPMDPTLLAARLARDAEVDSEGGPEVPLAPV